MRTPPSMPPTPGMRLVAAPTLMRLSRSSRPKATMSPISTASAPRMRPTLALLPFFTRLLAPKSCSCMMVLILARSSTEILPACCRRVVSKARMPLPTSTCVLKTDCTTVFTVEKSNSSIAKRRLVVAAGTAGAEISTALTTGVGAGAGAAAGAAGAGAAESGSISTPTTRSETPAAFSSFISFTPSVTARFSLRIPLMMRSSPMPAFLSWMTESTSASIFGAATAAGLAAGAAFLGAGAWALRLVANSAVAVTHRIQC